MDEILIRINWIYFLGIITSLIGIAWYTGGRFSKIETLIESIKERLSGLEDRFNKKIEAELGRVHSPIRPNEKGKEILKIVKWDEIYIDLKKDIFSNIDLIEPTNLYDVEKVVRDVIWEMRNLDEMKAFKIYAVNNPEFPLKILTTLASWLVRDDYAKEKEIKT